MRYFEFLLLSFLVFPLHATYFGIEDDDDGTIEVTNDENFGPVNQVITRLSYPGNVDLFFNAETHQIDRKNLKNLGGILRFKKRAEDEMLEKAIEHYLKGEAEILWVPDILWDLYMVERALKKGDGNFNRRNMARYAKDFLFWFFDEGGRQSLKVQNVYGYFKTTIAKLLRKIRNALSGPRQVRRNKEDSFLKGIDFGIQKRNRQKYISPEVKELAQLIVSEERDFIREQSIFNHVLKLQTDAREKNLALIYRDAPLRRGSLSVQDKDGDNRTINAYFLDSILGDENNLDQDLFRFERNLAQGEVETNRLSFNYSIFSGCLAQLEECPFYRYKRGDVGKRAIYALAFKKNWFLTKGRHFFFLPKEDQKSEIFEPNVSGVPSLKRIELKGADIQFGGDPGRGSGSFSILNDRNNSLFNSRNRSENFGPLRSFGQASHLDLNLDQFRVRRLPRLLAGMENPRMQKGLAALLNVHDQFAQSLVVLGISGGKIDSRYTKSFRVWHNNLRERIQNIIDRFVTFERERKKIPKTGGVFDLGSNLGRPKFDRKSDDDDDGRRRRGRLDRKNDDDDDDDNLRRPPPRKGFYYDDKAKKFRRIIY